MEDTKILAFVGSPCSDFIIYLSGIIHKLGKSVLVIDNTDQQAVMKCIPKPIEQISPIQYKNIDYMSTKDSKESEESAYENDQKINNDSYQVILVINNKDILDPSYFGTKYDEAFIITTLQKEPILESAMVIENIDAPIHLIYRDVCDCKISPEFCFYTYVKDKEKIVDRYQIELDQVDYEYRLCMEYEPYKEFKHLSNTYEKCLKEIISSLFLVSKKEINMAYKKAKKGGII